MSPERAAVGSALLLAAAAPPSPAFALVFVALVPLVGAIETLPRGSVGRHRAFRAGVVHGAVYWSVMLLWIPQVALRVGLWAAFGYLAVVSTLALLTGLATLLLHGLRSVGVWLPLALALAWVAVEWLRTAWLGPLSFPWMGLALPLAGVPAMIQGAAWVGEVGLAFAVAAVNGMVVLALARPPGRRLQAGALITVGLLGAFVAGTVRIERAGTEPVLRALLVQPDVALADKRGDASRALQVSLEAVEHIVGGEEIPSSGPLDVAVLPETAVPAPLDGEGEGVPAIRESVAGWSARLGVPVLVGAYGSGPGRGGNAVFLASSDPTRVWPAVWKTRRVPGVEWTPWGDDRIAVREGPATLDLPGGPRLGTLVCIESAGPEPARGMVAGGARVLVNVTNDSWLGERAWWTRSPAFFQHPAHLAFRAVEGGVGALRVGNNGRTEVVDPFGRRTLAVAPFQAGSGRAEVVSLRSPTAFVSLGPWVGTVALFVSLGLCLVPPRLVGRAFGRPGGSLRDSSTSHG